MAQKDPFQERKKQLQEVQNSKWDIIIVGGGITGAGIFRQASLDGYKVLLIEKEDFGSGTSWCSSKLIHGGLRYLEQFNFKLVFESIKEKHHLLKYAPDLVKPIPFLFPVYEQDRRPLSMIHMGTWIYSLLSKLKTNPKKFSAKEIIKKIPTINPDKLKGGVLYQDAQTVDSFLTLSCILSGQSKQSLALNHTCCQSFLSQNDQTHGILFKDEITQDTYQAFGKWVVNATGPWKELNHKSNVPMVYSKGSHLVLQGNPFKLESAITLFSPDDGRVIFCIPWLENTLLGTTDVKTKENPDHVSITQEEIEYLQNVLEHYFPGLHYKIISHFSGLRTLIGVGKQDLSKIKRDHEIDIPQKGLIQIYGGKLTAFTKMALDTMHLIQKNDSYFKTRRHLKSFISAYQPNIEKLSRKDILYFIEHEYAFTISDILIRRTLANIRLEDHGQRYLKLVQETLQTYFKYSEQDIKKQTQRFLIQSQQFDLDEKNIEL